MGDDRGNWTNDREKERQEILGDEPEPIRREEDARGGEGETDYLTEQLPVSTRFNIRLQVFIPSTLIILAFVLAGSLFTGPVATAFQEAQVWITSNLGWFYILSVNVFLVFVVWLALSRFGGIKLGPDDSEPEFGYFSWFTMLFSAGIGIGFLFYGVAEPVSHFAISPPPWLGADPGTPEAAREAMTVTFLHWGLHGWAIYIVIGLALCYFAYRRGLPLTMRSAFYPLIGDRIRGWMGDAIDTLAIFGTLFGVSISLGLGATQINSGLNYLIGIEETLTVQIILIAIITVIAVVSVVLGIHAGIRRLSLGNMTLFTILLVFVFVTGPTVFLVKTFLDTTGYYLRDMPVIALNSAAFFDSEWQGAWTLFYWGWWVSWCPFVGMFIARISRGRTIREFIAGVLLVPVLVSFLVFIVFGYTGIDAELTGEAGIVSATETSFESAFFAMLDVLPLATITSTLAVLIIVTFFITSSDSGSLVDDIHASGGNVEPERATRIYWGIAEGLVAATLLTAAGEAGLSAFQLSALVTGLPLSLLLLFMCYALVVSLRRDCAIQEMEERELLLEEARRASIYQSYSTRWPVSSPIWPSRPFRRRTPSQRQ